MTIDFSNFLLSLAVALAAECEPPITVGSDLFIHQANEAQAPGTAATKVYAVLRGYGGPVPEEFPGPFEVARPQTRSVQGMVNSLSATAAHGLAGRLFDALHDDEQLGRHHWVIDAKKLDAGAIAADEANPHGWQVRNISPQQPPGQIGTDAQGRVTVVFNFDVRFERKE